MFGAKLLPKPTITYYVLLSGTLGTHLCAQNLIGVIAYLCHLEKMTTIHRECVVPMHTLYHSKDTIEPKSEACPLHPSLGGVMGVIWPGTQPQARRQHASNVDQKENYQQTHIAKSTSLDVILQHGPFDLKHEKVHYYCAMILLSG